jgi:hypothetical protein
MDDDRALNQRSESEGEEVDEYVVAWEETLLQPTHTERGCWRTSREMLLALKLSLQEKKREERRMRRTTRRR